MRKFTDMKLYTEDGQELGTAEFEVNTQPSEPVDSAGLFGTMDFKYSGTTNTPSLLLSMGVIDWDTAMILSVLTDIRNGTSEHIVTADDALEAIQYVIDNRSPIPYWALVMLLQYAGLEIAQYKWVPVDQRPHETLEHAYRRVQLGDTIVRDNTFVILIPSEQYNSNNSDTLF